MNKTRLTAWVLLAVLALSVAATGQEEYEWKDGRWVKAPEPAKGTAAGELALIRRDFKRGWHRTTVRDVGKFLKKYPIEPEAEEAMLLAGRAEMRRGRYFQAFEWFERQITQFPNGQYFEQSLEQEYAIAEAFLGGKKRIVLKVLYLPAQEDGLMILERVVQHAPGSSLAETALLRMADYHFQKTDYLDAVRVYDRHLEVFSRSPKAAYAMLQAARASHGAFRGVDYDSSPLLDAQQRYRMFVERFPLEAERVGVGRILEDIRWTLARKDYHTAQFYERVGRPGPAAFYYRQVVRGYPQTEWEGKSRQALGRLGEPIDEATPATAPAASTEPAATQPADQGANP